MPPPFILCFSLLLFYRPSLVLTRPLPNEHHHKHLNGYLHKFGYLSKNPPTAAEFASAVSLYQSNHGLPTTGRLDPATLAQISTPRCGVSDATHPGVSRFAYFPGQPRWTRASPMVLTYAISADDTVDYIPRSQVESAVRRAFDRWARVIPVRFLPAEDYYTADVKVGFYGGDHGDGEAFDGVLGVLAHAFSPQSGRLHLDAAERWAVDFGREESKVAVDLESVATHEIGHVLGLGHSTVREAVMYPSLSPRTKKVELTVDDVEGVQALYGSNPNFNISSVLESDTSDAAGTGLVLRSVRRFTVGILLVIVCV